MPRPPAKDTSARRELNIMDGITRRLDELDDSKAVARVLTWVDGLVNGSNAEAELKAMRAIAYRFGRTDTRTRDSVVSWLRNKYGDNASVPTEEERPRPL